MKKSFILISIIALSFLFLAYSLVMISISWNRYRVIVNYGEFIRGYSLVNAGLSRLKYKIGQSDFTNESYPFASTSIAITIDQANNAATIVVPRTSFNLQLDVTYQGQILTAYDIHRQ